MTEKAKIRFWGVRGSIPTPLTSKDVEEKIVKAVTKYSLSFENRDTFLDTFLREYKKSAPFTYGGNTSCVEVRYGDHIFVLDMGTGLRPFGNSLFPEMLKQKGIKVHFFLSHVHWDHIQGLPFFGPLYVNKEKGILNSWHFYGGTDWQRTAEVCLRGQMDPPTFPVSWSEIQKINHEIKSCDMYDMMQFSVMGMRSDDTVKVLFRKLNHPQETYGVRLEFPNGKVIAYSTDNEPFDPRVPDPRLLDLAKGADVWITDCQYTREVYHGEVGGVCRHGWGHSYPEAVATTAIEANVKRVLLFHHDPVSSDDQIFAIENRTKSLIQSVGMPKSVAVQAAYEGLEISL